MLWNTGQISNNRPYSALQFARSTALYGFNSVSSEIVPYSFAVTKGWKTEPNKNSKSCLFFPFLCRGAGGYSAWGKIKGSIEPLVIVSRVRSSQLSLLDKTFSCDIRKALSYPRVQNTSVSHTLDSQESKTSRKHYRSGSKCNRHRMWERKTFECGWIRALPCFKTTRVKWRWGAAGQKPGLLMVMTHNDADVKNSMSGHYSHTHTVTQERERAREM